MSAIKAGDTVVVIGAVCEHSERDIGFVGTVIATLRSPTSCSVCGARMAAQAVAELERRGKHAWKPLVLLKKLDPDTEPEHVNHDTEITA